MHEAGLLLLDNTKSKTILGWEPRFGVDEAINRTLEWYRTHADGENMRKYSLDEIKKFQER